ncbi:MAG: hypothetical protein VZQ55_03760 [Ruminococcus sp.]|nr:hypothetical protein [Ruminococcus sp.]
MKSEYKTPSILIEDLEKVDVLLLESADTDTSTTKRLERENRYGNFSDFSDIMGFALNPKNWFD